MYPFFILTSNVYSQGNFSIHFGPLLPLSSFADDNLDDDEAGGAGIGFGLGVQYVYSLSESGLGLFGGIDFNYNGLKGDVKDDIKDLYDAMGINNAYIIYWKYINIPISAGLNYTLVTDNNISLIGNIGLTANFLKITDFVVGVDSEEIRVEFDLANSIGFKIGGGILLNNKTSIEINYLGLGDHDIEGKIEFDGESDDIDDFKQNVSILTLTIGFKF